MSLGEEANAILVRTEAAINEALDGTIAQIAKEHIARRVQTNVYDVYEPHGKIKYHRRKENGGLSDDFMYSQSVDTVTHTLTISDNRHEVGVVESGEGYTWLDADATHIQHWHMPRPYFKDAENDVAMDGEAEAALASAIAKI